MGVFGTGRLTRDRGRCSRWLQCDQTLIDWVRGGSLHASESGGDDHSEVTGLHDSECD